MLLQLVVVRSQESYDSRMIIQSLAMLRSPALAFWYRTDFLCDVIEASDVRTSIFFLYHIKLNNEDMRLLSNTTYIFAAAIYIPSRAYQ